MKTPKNIFLIVAKVKTFKTYTADVGINELFRVVKNQTVKRVLVNIWFRNLIRRHLKEIIINYLPYT